MRSFQGAPPVLNICAQEFGRELVFHLLYAVFVGFAKEKPDHPVGKNPLDECVDDFSEFKLAAQLVELDLLVQHGAVPHGDTGTEGDRLARVDVEDAPVLDVAALTDRDRCVVAPQHRAGPAAAARCLPALAEVGDHRRRRLARAEAWDAGALREGADGGIDGAGEALGRELDLELDGRVGGWGAGDLHRTGSIGRGPGAGSHERSRSVRDEPASFGLVGERGVEPLRRSRGTGS